MHTVSRAAENAVWSWMCDEESKSPSLPAARIAARSLHLHPLPPGARDKPGVQASLRKRRLGADSAPICRESALLAEQTARGKTLLACGAEGLVADANTLGCRKSQHVQDHVLRGRPRWRGRLRGHPQGERLAARRTPSFRLAPFRRPPRLLRLRQGPVHSRCRLPPAKARTPKSSPGAADSHCAPPGPCGRHRARAASRAFALPHLNVLAPGVSPSASQRPPPGRRKAAMKLGGAGPCRRGVASGSRACPVWPGRSAASSSRPRGARRMPSAVPRWPALRSPPSRKLPQQLFVTPRPVQGASGSPGRAGGRT